MRGVEVIITMIIEIGGIKQIKGTIMSIKADDTITIGIVVI